MRDRVVRGGAIAAAGLVFLAAACSSSGPGPAEAQKTSVDGSSTTAIGSTDRSTTTRKSITDPRGTGLVVTDVKGQPLRDPETQDYITVPSTTAPPATTTTLFENAPPEYVLQWKLAVDYRTHPGTNPFADYQGGPKVWSLRQGTQRNGDYAMLPQYSARFGAPSISGWHDDTPGCYRTPAIAANKSFDRIPVCTGEVPPNATWLAPSSSHMAVVAWTSLFDGNVRIDSGVADLDPSCGKGVRFFVDKGTTPLSEITLVNANAVMLQPPITTSVTFGESLFFIVDAGADGDASCDMTQLVVTILRLVPGSTAP